MEDKAALREKLRAARREHVASLDPATSALLFMRPPVWIADAVSADAVIGLYRATPHEARASGYAKFFHERGNAIALPRFASAGTAMEFAAFTDPFGESDLETGPFGIEQPSPDAETLIPDMLFVPLVGFTANGERLGQGGGHYDLWIAEHRPKHTIGLAWDCQLVEQLPSEAHDQRLDAVITPTRLFGGL